MLRIAIIAVALVASAAGVAFHWRTAGGIAHGDSYAPPEKGRNAYRISYVGWLAVYCGQRDAVWIADLQTQWQTERLGVAQTLGLERVEAITIMNRTAQDGMRDAQRDAPSRDEAVCSRLPQSDNLAEADQIVARWRDGDWSDMKRVQGARR